MEIELDSETVKYEVRESSRAKHPSIKSRRGRIQVVIPQNSGISPEEILRSRKKWVKEKADENREYREKIPERDFSEGSSIEVLGAERKIRLEKARKNRLEDRKIILAKHLVEQTCVRDQLEKVLRLHARKEFETRAKKYSERVGKEYDKIYVRDQKTRWGSCSSNSNLNFNWRLVLGPEHVLDYVVAHEVTHLKYLDHSKKFYSLLEQVFPDYRRSESWLEQNSAKLVFDTKGT